MGIVYVIASGKGGTGKTSLTGGIGSCLAAVGHRVLCIDGDIGLRNLDLALGMSSQILMDFNDVIEGRCSLTDAAAEHALIHGLYLLTAPVSVSAEQISAQGFRDLVDSARKDFDYILIDAPAGIGPGLKLAACAADRMIITVTADPASLRDGQRTADQFGTQIELQQLVVNRVQPRLLRRMKMNIDDAMDTVGLGLLGLVPEDSRVPLAAGEGKPVIMTGKRGAPMAYYRIAQRMEGKYVPLGKI